MESEWPETLLEELADEVTVGFVGSMASEYVEDGIPFFRSKNVAPYRILWDDMKYISRQFHEKIAKSSLHPGDVVIVRTGKPGTASIIPDTIEEANCSDLVIVRPGPKLDKRFLAYYLNSAAIHHINAHLVGAVQQHFNVGAAKKLSIPLPPFPEQKAIAHILGCLDDKIELNRRMNATLEGMAQALFQSWFVDFDPVIDNTLAAGNPLPDELAERAETRSQALADGTANREAGQAFPAAFQRSEELGWIPEGWEMAKLSDLLEVKYGKAHQKLSEGNIPVYGSGGLMRHADKSLYSGESVLIPRKGTLSNILYLNEEFWTVDTMFYTIPKRKFVPKYIFHHLKSLDFVSMNVGSAVPSMTTKVLNALPILMPFESVLQEFDSILISYFDKTEANNVQSKTLAALRDTLLPKLISGDLRIPDAAALAEEALA
ncbi:MAG: restriction endonuclease subunit S [Nitrospirales bacterium]